MYRGVYPINFDPNSNGIVSIERQVITELIGRGDVTSGDRIILTKGDLDGVAGGTNTMKVLTVE